MPLETEHRANDQISEVRLNKRYRAIIHKEATIYRQDVPVEICRGRLDIQRKRDGAVVGSITVDLTGMFEVTDMDKRYWRSIGQKFLQKRTKNPR